MSTNPKITEIEVAPDEARATASTAGGFKMFNRVLDWITSDRMQLINITDRINEIVRKSGVHDGIVHLQSLHTTTAVFLNEWQDALLQDVKRFLDDVVAQDTARVGATAAELSLARLHGDRSRAKTVTLPTSLIRRGSGEIPASALV